MMDYIALLLAGHTLREEEDPSFLETEGETLPRRGEEREEERTEESREETSPTPAEVRAGEELQWAQAAEPSAGGGGPGYLLAGMRDPAWPGEETGRLSGGMGDEAPGRGALPRAASTGAIPADRKGEAAAWADRGVRTSLASLPAPPVPVPSAAGPAPASGTAGELGAEALDRLFRRDARRYDGGFSLL